LRNGFVSRSRFSLLCVSRFPRRLSCVPSPPPRFLPGRLAEWSLLQLFPADWRFSCHVFIAGCVLISTNFLLYHRRGLRTRVSLSDFPSRSIPPPRPRKFPPSVASGSPLCFCVLFPSEVSLQEVSCHGACSFRARRNGRFSNSHLPFFSLIWRSKLPPRATRWPTSLRLTANFAGTPSCGGHLRSPSFLPPFARFRVESPLPDLVFKSSFAVHACQPNSVARSSMTVSPPAAFPYTLIRAK